MCYHTHSSPNESIDFAVLRCTQSIDSFGKNGDIFSICTIYIFQTFFGTFPMTFLQKFSNQKVQFSIEINNIPKKLFEKSVRNLSIHLKLLHYAVRRNSTGSLFHVFPTYKHTHFILLFFKLGCYYNLSVQLCVYSTQCQTFDYIQHYLKNSGLNC